MLPIWSDLAHQRYSDEPYIKTADSYSDLTLLYYYHCYQQPSTSNYFVIHTSFQLCADLYQHHHHSNIDNTKASSPSVKQHHYNGLRSDLRHARPAPLSAASLPRPSSQPAPASSA